MKRESLQKGASIIGGVLSITAFFVLLMNPYMGWAMLTIAVFLLVYSLFTDSLPHLK